MKLSVIFILIFVYLKVEEDHEENKNIDGAQAVEEDDVVDSELAGLQV